IRTVGPRAKAVDIACNNFFAGAGFADEQYRGARIRNEARQPINGAHGRTIADNAGQQSIERFFGRSHVGLSGNITLAARTIRVQIGSERNAQSSKGTSASPNKNDERSPKGPRRPGGMSMGEEIAHS